MRKKTFALRFLSVNVLLTTGLGLLLSACTTAPEYSSLLDQAAKEINVECPIMVDNETRLDSVATAPNLTFIYYYSLIYMDKVNVNIEELKGYLKPNILDNAQYNEALQDFRQNKVSMVYRYADMEGSFLFEINVKPDDYLEEADNG